MNYISKSIMGSASGFISIGGQLAAFISPLIIGYLIQASGGRFFTTFTFLIGAAFVSFLIVVTMGDGKQREIS
jgi:nitrate/nitrite transporter NarK